MKPLRSARMAYVIPGTASSLYLLCSTICICHIHKQFFTAEDLHCVDVKLSGFYFYMSLQYILLKTLIFETAEYWKHEK
jgi:hypothetical protein